MKSSTILLALPVWAILPTFLPDLCISTSSITLDADRSVMSATIDDGFGWRCVAIMSFSNLDFPSVSYSFELVPCSGQQITSILVPLDAPDGEAYVTWQCSGLAPVCSYVNIIRGSENRSMELQVHGTAGCVSEASQASTALVTTTSRSSSIITASLPTMLISATISLPTSGSYAQASPSAIAATSLRWPHMRNGTMIPTWAVSNTTAVETGCLSTTATNTGTAQTASSSIGVVTSGNYSRNPAAVPTPTPLFTQSGPGSPVSSASTIGVSILPAMIVSVVLAIIIRTGMPAVFGL
ncbi:hypothetical protein F5Y11DRAFT_170270 [Daldinia sp. FL1419]|nr:hypothetical protein F5Y11DRAFT_170270 [Daldinia sp. FL1419]